MSIETISKAVWSSRRLASTALEIMSGFSSTVLWLSADPIAETIPWPTRAMIVSSVAPPMSWARLARTVTRALTINWIPSLAIASRNGLTLFRGGQSMTLG